MAQTLSQCSFFITVNSRARRIFRFEETNTGSVFIAIFSGSQIGIPPDHIEVTERRYSIHPTPENNELNAIHYTFKLNNGDKKEHFNYTDAIKSREGYVPIFCELFPSLAARKYDMRTKHFKSSFELGNYDLTEKCLIVYLIACHKDASAPERIRDDIKIVEYVAGDYKFIMLLSCIEAPATEFAWHTSKITENPEDFANEADQIAARQFMEKSSWNDCLIVFDLWRIQLYRTYLNNLIEHPPEPGVDEWARLQLTITPSTEDILRTYGAQIL